MHLKFVFRITSIYVFNRKTNGKLISQNEYLITTFQTNDYLPNRSNNTNLKLDLILC